MSRRSVLAVLSAGLVVAGGASTLGPLRATATGTVTDYQFPGSSNGQFATRGSLGLGSSVNVQVKAVNGSAAVPGATVYLTYAGASGSSATVSIAQCASGSLGTTPTACTADTSGLVTVTFHAPAVVGGTLPTGGAATITAQDASSSPSISESVQYFWGLATKYVWSAEPWAAPGMAATMGGSTNFTVTAEKADSSTVTGTAIYLSLSTTASAPGVAVAIDSGSTCGMLGTVTLSTTPQKVSAASGTVTICYTAPPTPEPGIDTITAQDDGTFQTFSTANHYNQNNQTLASLVWSPNPIASAGTLGSSAAASPKVTAMDNPLGGSPSPIPYLTIYVGFTPASDATASATPWTSPASVPLSSSVQAFSTDGNGVLQLAYTTGTNTTGTDRLVAQDKASTPTITSSDLYTYALATHYVFSAPWTPSAPFMAAQGGTAPSTVTLTAEDVANNPVPNTVVWLTFTPTGPQTTSPASAKVGGSSGTPLTTTPQMFVTDSTTGTITVTYAKDTGTSPPTGGQDVIGAQNTQTSPTITATDSYLYGTAVDYVVSPKPIAPAGTLNPGDITTATYTVYQHGTTTPDPSATVYLSFVPATGGGSATVSQCGANTTLTATPVPCTPDNNGDIVVTYSAPSPLPAGGTDTVTAADAPKSPFVTQSDAYRFVGGYTFTPNPFAPGGTLTTTAPRTGTLTVTDGTTPLAGAAVWLSFVPASGSTATLTAGGTTVTSTPAQFTTDGSGHIALSYTRSAQLPGGGADTLTAGNASSSPTLSATDGYSYVGQFAFSPAGPKIAPDGSLAHNTLRVVTITAEDSNGTPLPGAKFDLKFVPAAGGGSAQASGQSLGASPILVTADGNGNVPVDYTTPSTLPAGGTDVVTVLNQQASPTISATDSYSFQVPPPPPPSHGYYMVASDGGLFPFGSALQHSYGSEGGNHLNQPIVGMAMTPDGNGYYMVAADGGIFPFGDAVQHSYGSTGGMHLNRPIVGMAVRPDFNGYYLVASDGGIFPFGPSATAHSYGSTGNMHLNAPIVGMAMTNDGGGYWLVASDGGIFPFGDALQHSYGSEGGSHLNQPIVGMAATADGNGYYLVASDGGLFPFGDALQHSYGSEGGTHLNQPIVGMALATDGNGYYMVASDGGLFPFGSALNASYGSEGGSHLNQPIVGMAAI